MGAIGAVYGLLAVGAGAFGSHGLRSRRPPELVAVFETGARYQMYHALALLLLAVLVRQLPERQRGLVAAGWAWTVGVLVFSGSLYALVLSEIRTLGAITPLGGLLLMAGWVLLAVALVRTPHAPSPTE